MNERFLPIGTICTLNGVNKKIMITGFFGVSYKGMVKMYDYVGYEYPEGMLLQNRSYLFNHENIVEVNFMGYISSEHEILKNNLLKNNVSEEKVESNGIFTNFKFDENGVVIFDGSVKETPKTEEEPKNATNPFNEIYKKPVENKEKNNKEIFSKFKFDKNGVVIAEEQSSNASGFKFDENGFVIADNTVKTKDTKSTNIQSEDNVSKESGFKFDENGMVISDETVNVSNNIPNTQYQFDENGVVIGEGA